MGCVNRDIAKTERANPGMLADRFGHDSSRVSQIQDPGVRRKAFYTASELQHNRKCAHGTNKSTRACRFVAHHAKLHGQGFIAHPGFESANPYLR